MLAAFFVHGPRPVAAQSTDATLSSLVLEASTDGTNFSSLGFRPHFASSVDSYEAGVLSTITHVRVRPTTANSAATVEVGKSGSLSAVDSGSNSPAIGLSDGSQNILAKVTAEDGNTSKTYTIAICKGGCRRVPASPQNVSATPGDGHLTITWQMPTYWGGNFPKRGLEVDWYPGASTPSDPSDWRRATPVSSPLAATATSYRFGGTYGGTTISNGNTYQVRVRSFVADPDDLTDTIPSDWVVVQGTPRRPQVSFAQAEYSFAEGTGSLVRPIRLWGRDMPVRHVNLTINIDPPLENDSQVYFDPSNDYANTLCKGTGYHTARPHTDYLRQWRAVRLVDLPAGASSVTFSVPIVDDDFEEPEEYFTVCLHKFKDARRFARETISDYYPDCPRCWDWDLSPELWVRYDHDDYEWGANAPRIRIKIPANDTGQQQQPQFYSADTPPGSPGPVGNLQAEANPQKGKILVTWEQPDTNGEDIAYRVELTWLDVGGEIFAFAWRSREVLTVKRRHVFKNLEPGNIYHIVVTPGNNAGAGQETRTSVTMPEPDEPNRAPTVRSAFSDQTLVNGSGLFMALSGRFDDTDGDSLTFTAASSDETKATAKILGVGESSTLGVTTMAVGTATITVTAEDGNGGTVEDAFTVTVVKGPPMVIWAISDVTGLEVDGTREVSLAGVFYDADGDALTITATSSDETKATVTVASDGSKLTLAGVGVGTATITVTAQDTDGNRVSDTFNVAVTQATQSQQANRAPTVSNAIADATVVNEGGTHEVSLPGVFSDADKDALTITAASSDNAKATVTVASDYSGLAVAAQARGTATITVTANDGNDGTVDDVFTVTVKAAPVVASALPDVADLEEDSTQDVSLSEVFSDADGDALTVTASSSDDAKATVTLAADQSNLTVAGVAEGTATITVTAQDSDGNRVSDTFDVAVNQAPQLQQANRAPTVASATGDVTIVNESGTREVSQSGVFSDADNDSLTITAASSDETKATVSVSSDYSSLTVTARGRGTATITVTADDGYGGTVDDTFTVTVKTAPVVASGLADVSGLEAGGTQDVSLTGAFSDADNDTLTITASSSDDAKATVTVSPDGSTLTVAGVAEGTATITVTAQDSDNNTVSDTFEVSVVEIPGPVVNLQPSATSDSVTVSWQAPESGGTPQDYIVHLKKEGGKKGSGKIKRPKAKKTSVTFKNLEPGQTYKVWVRAQNEGGKGERSHGTITLPQDGQSQG